MMSERTFIDAREIAQLLGLPDGAAFLRRRTDLEDHHGFPIPMPHWKRPIKYRRDQVMHWIDLHGTPKGEEPAIDPALIASGKVRMLAEARRS
jgi:hypothetical protein